MWSIYRREIGHYLHSLTAYVSIAVFLVVLGLIVWILPDFSVIEGKEATLSSLFNLAPFVLLFLIPALSMRSFAEEKADRTLDLLWMKPVSSWDIVGAKFLSVWSICVLAIVPTIIYAFSINRLGNPVGSLDNGELIGSYFGLILLAAVFTAVAIFASALTQNQIVAFLLAVLLLFMMHYGFLYFSKLPIFFGKTDNIVQEIGIAYHYRSLSKGLIELSDLIYMLGITISFLMATVFIIKKNKQ